MSGVIHTASSYCMLLFSTIHQLQTLPIKREKEKLKMRNIIISVYFESNLYATRLGHANMEHKNSTFTSK